MLVKRVIALFAILNAMAMRYPCPMDNRIREFRERRGWSQSELAERVGVHWQTVQRVESGKTEPGTAKMSRYAEALGVSLEALRPIVDAPLMPALLG